MSGSGRRFDPCRTGRRRVASVAIAAALVSAAAAGSPRSLAGQRASPAGERSPLVGAALQAVLPPLPLGYIYAGDLERAILPTTLMVGGGAAFVLGVVELIDWTDEPRSPTLFYAGLGAMMVGYVYGVVDAADAVRDRNDRIRRGAAAVDIRPARGGGLSIRVSLSAR